MLYLALVLLLITAIFVFQMSISKPSPGANDNGSGLVVLLELAKRLDGYIPPDKNIRLLATGAEELGFFGIRNYIKKHKNLSSNETLFINLECVGAGELYWAFGEEFFFKTKYPQKAIQTIELLQANNAIPILPKTAIIAPTDAGPLAKNNYNVVTLIGLKNGIIPENYHRITDTFGNLNQETLGKAADLIESIIKS